MNPGTHRHPLPRFRTVAVALASTLASAAIMGVCRSCGHPGVGYGIIIALVVVLAAIVAYALIPVGPRRSTYPRPDAPQSPEDTDPTNRDSMLV